MPLSGVGAGRPHEAWLAKASSGMVQLATRVANRLQQCMYINYCSMLFFLMSCSTRVAIITKQPPCALSAPPRRVTASRSETPSLRRRSRKHNHDPDSIAVTNITRAPPGTFSFDLKLHGHQGRRHEAPLNLHHAPTHVCVALVKMRCQRKLGGSDNLIAGARGIAEATCVQLTPLRAGQVSGQPRSHRSRPWPFSCHCPAPCRRLRAYPLT